MIKQYGFILFLTLIPFTATAGISLNKSIIHLEAGKNKRDDVEILNTGKEPLYLQVEPSIIHNPGTAEEKREPYVDPRQAGLLVTPAKLVLAPGTRKRVRFVRLDYAQNKKDKVYRVIIKPVVGDIQAQQTAVKVVIAYEVLVLARPLNAKAKLEAKREKQTLSFSNTGNTNVLLQRGKQCKSWEPETECVDLPGKRIYAGNTWSIELPYNTPVDYYYSIGNENAVTRY